jgi:hypothetical protein
MRKIALLTVLLVAGVSESARPGPAVAPVVQGYIAQRSGDVDGALDAFLEALKVDPDSVAIRMEAASRLGCWKSSPDSKRRPQRPGRRPRWAPAQRVTPWPCGFWSG